MKTLSISLLVLSFAYPPSANCVSAEHLSIKTCQKQCTNSPTMDSNARHDQLSFTHFQDILLSHFFPGLPLSRFDGPGINKMYDEGATPLQSLWKKLLTFSSLYFAAYSPLFPKVKGGKTLIRNTLNKRSDCCNPLFSAMNLSAQAPSWELNEWLILRFPKNTLLHYNWYILAFGLNTYSILMIFFVLLISELL